MKKDKVDPYVDLGVVEARHPVTKKAIEVAFARDVRVVGDPKAEALDLPRKYAWYARLRDMAANELREAQHEEYNMEEDLYVDARREQERDGTKKATETELKTNVKAHPRMRSAYRVRMEAERRYEELESVVKMLAEKRAALQVWAKVHAAEVENGIGD